MDQDKTKKIEIEEDSSDSDNIIDEWNLPFQNLKHRYFRINMVGNSSTVDLVAPVDQVESFSHFMDCAMFLSLFLSDDNMKDIQKRIFKKHLEKIVKKQSKEK